MLNIYKYYDDYESLPMYTEIGGKIRLLNPNFWKYEKPKPEDFKPIMHILLKSAKMCYYYASDVLHGRFPEGEPIIMKSPYTAFLYAKNIMKGRWPGAEPYIKKDADKAFRYASDILAKDPEWTNQPGHENGRWPEAEPYIMKSPYEVYYYSRDIIGGRWPEAEPYILDDNEYGQSYKQHFGIE